MSNVIFTWRTIPRHERKPPLPPSRRSPRRYSVATAAPGSSGPPRSTGRTCAVRSCPGSGRRPIGDITHSEVQRWFAALHATLAAANRSLPILSVILRHAEIYGHRPDGSNPCTGLRRYRERGRDRFLTGDEFRRLGAALAAHEVVTPLAFSVVRLLALQNCWRWPTARRRGNETPAGSPCSPGRRRSSMWGHVTSTAGRMCMPCPRRYSGDVASFRMAAIPRTRAGGGWCRRTKRR